MLIGGEDIINDVITLGTWLSAPPPEHPGELARRLGQACKLPIDFLQRLE